MEPASYPSYTSGQTSSGVRQTENLYSSYADKQNQDLLQLDLKDTSENIVERCKKAYFEHCLEEAFRLVEIFYQKKSQPKADQFQNIERLANENAELFQNIKEEHSYMHKVLGELNTTEGWIVDSVGSSATLSYKYINGIELVTIKLEADVEVPVQNMLTLVNEINLWDHWVPFMKRALEIKRLHRSAAVYYAELGLPYPLHNREVHLYGYAVNRLYENGSILILAESVDENKVFLERNKIKKVEHSGTVNMDIHFAGFELMPLERNKCRLRGVANINPKFKWIPISVLNFVVKKGIQFVMDRLINKAKNFKGSVWEKEMMKEEKRAFYEWLNEVIEEYYQNKKI